MKLIDEFMEGLYNCDKVIIKATGIGETEYSTVEIYDAIYELRQHKSKPITEINIDYYNELKAKADAFNLIMKLTGNGNAVLKVSDEGAKELRPCLEAVKKFKESEGK